MEKPTRALMKTHHIIFDAIGCAAEKLNSEQFVFSLLMEIPKLIGMKIMTGPHMARDHSPDNAGISGFAIVSFSHISIHTFPKTNEIYVDVFSCRPFDYEKVRHYLYGTLGVARENVETHEVKYPWEGGEQPY